MGVGRKVSLIFLVLWVCCQAAVPQWWKTASFYQIYPRSFKDSDGDGVGDLKGITQNLRYLKEIGVTATWLSPIFSSPMADFGYDVSNFTDIDPLFGTMADFDNLMARAKKLGIKIILDFVPNHSSDECEWFKKSAANDSYYKEFYIWHPGKVVNGVRQPPTNWIGIFRGKMWTYHKGRGQYYLHQFLAKQPDLNYRNPKVVEDMKDVLRFWLRKGVSGFRVDAIPHTFEVAADSEGNFPDEPRNLQNNDPEDYDYLQHIYTKDQPETIDLVYQFRQVMDEMKAELQQKDDLILMTEAFTNLGTVMQYYGNTTHEGAQIPFNFELLWNINKESTAHDYEKYINNWLNSMPRGKTANWFMGNHDRSRVGSRLGESMIDMINILLMALPGCCITYQGEEIGMTNARISWQETKDPQACVMSPETYEKYSRDPGRAPFQWNNQSFAGFTKGATTWLPVADNYRFINVESERHVYRSHLSLYKKVKFLRKNEIFQRGTAEVKALSKEVLAIKRSLTGHESFIVLLNLSDTVQAFDLNQHFAGLTPKLKYVVVTARSDKHQGQISYSHAVLLNPKESVILKTL